MRDLHLLIAFIASTPPCLSIHSSVRPSMYTLHSPVSYSSIAKKNTTTDTYDHEKLSSWTKATRPKPGWHKVNLHNAHGSKWKQTVFVVCQCESKNHPLRFSDKINPKRLGIFNQFLHTNYTFLSTLDDKFLFNYFQLWRSHAILSATTQRFFTFR